MQTNCADLERALVGHSATRIVLSCIDRLATHEFDGPVSRLRSGGVVRSWAVPPFRIYYQRLPAELLIVRVYHQKRRPIER